MRAVDMYIKSFCALSIICEALDVAIYSASEFRCTSIKAECLLEINRFWRWFILLRIIRIVVSVHRPAFQEL
jgi:hypothetical protein